MRRIPPMNHGVSGTWIVPPATNNKILNEGYMTSLKFGCQTYSWEMLGGKWHGTPEMILDAMSVSGYRGVEFSNGMIGRYMDHPDDFGIELERRQLACAAFAYARNGFIDDGGVGERLVARLGGEDGEDGGEGGGVHRWLLRGGGLPG